METLLLFHVVKIVVDHDRVFGRRCDLGMGSVAFSAFR
jgi:hypothetical protein